MLRAALTAIGGGLVGGLVVWAFLPSAGEGGIQPDPKPTVPTPQPAVATDVAPADDRESRTEARIRRLERMVKMLQRRQAEQAKLDAEETRVATGSAEGKAEDATPNRVTLNAADPRFEQAVRTVIDKARGEQEQSRTDRSEERRDNRVTRKVDYLSDKLGLSIEQQQKADEILFSQAEAMRALFRGDERPVTRKQWKERMAAIREETSRRLAEVLTAQQNTNYEKLQQDEGFNTGWIGH
jgi:hypothetical protein